MESLWNLERTDKKKTPYEYIKEQCEELYKLTNQRIIAKIVEYDGKYKSSTGGYFVDLKSLSVSDVDIKYGLQEKEGYNVQTELGDNGRKFVYEFFLTSLATPKYKYRIMFIAFNISIYPVEISVEKSITEELKMGESEFIVRSEEEFLDILKEILQSRRVAEVINNLMNFDSLAVR